MKDNVAAFWVAIGAKPVIGRFSLKALEESGFECPTLSFPLRNPLEIAKNAHKITQDIFFSRKLECIHADILD